MSWQARIKTTGVLLCGTCLLAALLFAPGASTAPAGTADLSVAKSDSPDPVQVGQVLTYTIKVTNAGPQNATGVALTDALPNHSDYVSASSSSGTCDHKGNRVVCDIGNLNADPSGGNAVTVLVQVKPSKVGTITNTASVDGAQTDPNPANNKSDASTKVTAAKPSTCRGVAATITGTPGGDRLVGTDGPDVIVGLGGGDTIVAGKGRDLVCSGGGSDRVNGGAAADRVFGGSGGDRLLGRGGPDLLAGNAGRDYLAGGAGSDRLRGGGGTDRCVGGAGRDSERSCEGSR